MMATTCFGPPPLPPNKKSLLPLSTTSHHHHHCSGRVRKYSQGSLSSTYHSFRDPSEDEIIVLSSEEMEMSSLRNNKVSNAKHSECCSRKVHKKKCVHRKCSERRNGKHHEHQSDGEMSSPEVNDEFRKSIESKFIELKNNAQNKIVVDVHSSFDGDEKNEHLNKTIELPSKLDSFVGIKPNALITRNDVLEAVEKLKKTSTILKTSELFKTNGVLKTSESFKTSDSASKTLERWRKIESQLSKTKQIEYNNNSSTDDSSPTIDYKTIDFNTGRKRCSKKCHSKNCRKLMSNSNSLNRSVKSGLVTNKLSLVRSHSDGNLAKKASLALPAPPTTFNKCMKVLSGSWKNLLQLGGMSRPPKPTPQAKKVAPPAVPHEFRHSGSSFGSAGYASSEDGVFLPDSTTAPPRDDHSDYGSTVSGVSSGKSPGPASGGSGSYGGSGGGAFTFPTGPGQVISHKQAVYYHHQLSLQEDQGIDMTQSPGRDSPGSSSGSAGSGSRHSTASLDSGRASSYHPLSSVGGSSGAPGARCSPRCSLSSCSIGSEGRIERLIAQGVPDQDIIHAWLTELHFEEYFPLFMSAGYDLPTIGRMTPEDLTAIGIKKPNHRKRLKAEIAQLNLPDNLPDYIPGSVEEWLRLLRLEEYASALHGQGYQSVEDVTQLTWEDLEDIGIVKLGHQKKFMLAIKRVKDIRAGKRFHLTAHPPHSLDVGQTQDHILITSPLIHAPPASSAQQGSDITDGPSPAMPTNVHTTFRAFHQPWEVDQTLQMTTSCYSAVPPTHHLHYYQPMYCTDIVPIKIRGVRGKSLESLEDPNERSTHHTFSADNTQTFYYQQTGGWRPRSYDDGDITPTNECALMYEGGGGTLPRPRGLVRPRPVAKIQAKTREPAIFQQHDYDPKQFIADKCYIPGQIITDRTCFTGNQYKSLPRDFIDKFHQMGGINSSPHKKLPPSPPKRQSSNSALESCITENPNCEKTTVEIHATSSPLPLPAYPSSDSLSISLDGQTELPLPPPPAPATPPGAGTQRIMPSKSWGSSGEEQELIAALALQHRNGSDASFKSSSSTESDSLPFANENAGTIKTRASNVVQRPPSRAGLPPHSSPGPHSVSPLSISSHSSSPLPTVPRPRSQPADVLNDIGNMLANLTDELDAMLEEEKRQGLTDVQ